MDSHWKGVFTIYSLSFILLVSTIAIECRRLNLNPELLRQQNDGNQEPVTIRLDKSPEQLGEKSPWMNFLFHRIRRAIGGQPVDGTGSPSSYAYHFNDSHYVAQVHWSGVNSSSIMVLMKDPDYSVTSDRPSYFYVSHDYGKSFENLTSKFVVENGTIAILTNFFGSRSSNMVYALVAKYQQYIFMSLDECKNFTPVKVDFYVNEVKFHPKQYFYILAHEGEAASSRRLYVSTDIGRSWRYMASSVRSYFWYTKGSNMQFAEGFAALGISRDDTT